MVFERLRRTALQTLPVHLEHGVQLGLREVELVEGRHQGADQERHLLGEALGCDLEAELGGLDRVDETSVERRVRELGEVVLEHGMYNFEKYL